MRIFLIQGDSHTDVPEAGPGDVVAVAKMKDVHTGDVLTNEKKGVHLPEPHRPIGVLSSAVAAVDRADEDKLFTALGKLTAEDPALQI